MPARDDYPRIAAYPVVGTDPFEQELIAVLAEVDRLRLAECPTCGELRALDRLIAEYGEPDPEMVAAVFDHAKAHQALTHAALALYDDYGTPGGYIASLDRFRRAVEAYRTIDAKFVQVGDTP